MNAAAAREFLKGNDLKYILAQFVDIHGFRAAMRPPAAFSFL
jgi:hypothetical protein